ncbi:sushi, nidogen and EGF-like domain-containing protein 1 [Branchiostoma floridae]|uniref:Sushi, nidogen and EGF-like domain-containing protein 1 n=1 Tax=Branchiostoma floridae TaxID=7739 RepID=A0A9J7HWA3_BRAFL|nr:sushi, nidogen and EGF-like domain-containing protein 1 [Branchiostoma floridae]
MLPFQSYSLPLLAVLLLGSAAGSKFGQTLRSGSTSNFYPFGPSAGDRANPKVDDGGSGQLSVSLPAGFRYFGSVYHNFWVNNNGLVSFRGQVSQFTPSPFPIQSFPTVAVFWGDVDNRHAGEVYWRQTTSDQSLISRVSQDILRNYPDIPSFQARWVLVTTYYDVTYFGGSPTTNRQSFQAVLATDRTYSFAIFKYGDIVWTTGTASEGDRETGLGGIPAQAGFNAGDGTNYYTVPGSRSAEIVQIETRTNVGQPGTFMFRIDPFTIIPLGNVMSIYLFVLAKLHFVA